jgi:hypothetical protein
MLTFIVENPAGSASGVDDILPGSSMVVSANPIPSLMETGVANAADNTHDVTPIPTNGAVGTRTCTWKTLLWWM